MLTKLSFCLGQHCNILSNGPVYSWELHPAIPYCFQVVMTLIQILKSLLEAEVPFFWLFSGTSSITLRRHHSEKQYSQVTFSFRSGEAGDKVGVNTDSNASSSLVPSTPSAPELSGDACYLKQTALLASHDHLFIWVMWGQQPGDVRQTGLERRLFLGCCCLRKTENDQTIFCHQNFPIWEMDSGEWMEISLWSRWVENKRGGEMNGRAALHFSPSFLFQVVLKFVYGFLGT